MGEQEFKHLRKQYLVDRPYQLRFVTRVFAVVLAVAVISSLIATTLLWNTMYKPELGMQIHLTVSLIAVAITLLMELLIAIPIVFYLGIRQSHRIVGPMNRLKATLAAIGEGDFSKRITLREGDALEDLAKAINAMAERLQSRGSR